MPTATQILTRALWLAFQASAPMGMGYLHANSAAKQTESTLLTECEPQTLSDGSLQVWTDYVCGRMMKTGFKVDKDGNLSITPETPRGDYQSWARKYATAAELVEATNQSFLIRVTSQPGARSRGAHDTAPRGAPGHFNPATNNPEHEILGDNILGSVPQGRAN